MTSTALWATCHATSGLAKQMGGCPAEMPWWSGVMALEYFSWASVPRPDSSSVLMQRFFHD